MSKGAEHYRNGNTRTGSSDQEMNKYYKGTGYVVTDFCLYQGLGGLSTAIICHFVPIVTKEITIDDGNSERIYFEIYGYDSTGNRLKTVKIPTSKFSNGKWILESWGLSVGTILNSKKYTELAKAIMASGNLHAKKIKVYSNTGWVLIDEQYVFLHADGAIGKDDLLINLPSNLTKYTLSESVAEIAPRVYTCLDFLSIAPKEITVPLISIAFLSPLNEFFRIKNKEPSFVLFLLGQTQSFKTTLGALTLCFFGNFGADLPFSFNDTANALESYGHILKDVLMIIDDYYPSSNPRAMDIVMQRILRGYGNRDGRNRMNPDTTMKAAYIPRGNVIATGEMLSNVGQSGLSRQVVVNVSRYNIDVPLLSKVQKNKRHLSELTTRYIEWLSQQTETLPETVMELFYAHREVMSTAIQDFRLRESLAWLAVGRDMFLRFITSLNVLTEDKVDNLEHELDVFIKLGENNLKLLQEEKQSARFIEILLELLATSAVHVLHTNTDNWIHGSKKGSFIGYEDDEYYYLFPETVYNEVKCFSAKQGAPLGLNRIALYNQLASEGLIEKDTEGKNAKKKRIKGLEKAPRLLYLKKMMLQTFG